MKFNYIINIVYYLHYIVSMIRVEVKLNTRICVNSLKKEKSKNINLFVCHFFIINIMNTNKLFFLFILWLFRFCFYFIDINQPFFMTLFKINDCHCKIIYKILMSLYIQLKIYSFLVNISDVFTYFWLFSFYYYFYDM